MTDCERLNGPHSRRQRKPNVKKKLELNQNAIIERNIISCNWEKFLQSQPKTEKKTIEPKKSLTEKQNDSYWKAKRLEKKNNLKLCSSPSVHLKKLNLNSELDGNYSSRSEADENKEWTRNTRNGPTATKYVAMDCEMVGIGENGNDNMLARVSLVNKFGDCIYDKFVQAREKVVDYRTYVSGIRKEDMLNGESFEVVQREVAEILKGKFLVGHALKNDMEVLFLSHPRRKIRDTSRYKPFKKVTKGSTPSLKRLAKELLGVSIQGGEHSSVEDARAAMQLYCLHAREWENSLLTRDRKRN